MSPTLSDGDGVIAVRSRRARVGQIRVVRRPDQPSMWVVKRVSAVHADGSMELRSDDPDSANTDSRHFGRVKVAGSYWVLCRFAGAGR